MKKLTLLSIALLMGVSVWADDVINVSVYDDCSKNGYQTDIRPTGFENGYEWVNLGLPSGIKWASCNVGAETPEGYGNYYAWGEVTTKEIYSWSTYKYVNGISALTKYCNDSTYGYNGFIDSKIILDLEDDAAHVNWGGAWCMPTDAEWSELLSNCTWTWITQNNVNGFLVKSNTNSNSIFLPAAGFRLSEKLNRAGECGYYLSSSLDEDGLHGAFCFYFDSSRHQCSVSTDRSTGFPVRPICQTSSNATSLNDFVTLTFYADGCEEANIITAYEGQKVNVTAVPNEHRHFVRWSDGNTDNPRFVTVTTDTTLTAEFEYDPYLTLIADEKGSVIGTGYFKSNSSCEISATANYGYHFTQWSDGNTDNPRTIVLTCDTTFTAEFGFNQYTISAEVNDAERGSIDGATTIDYLDSVTLSATSNYGYHFAQWNDGNTDNPRKVRVIGNETYTAVFEKNSYTITTIANGVQGSVSVPSQAEYLDQVTLTPNAKVGYHFTQWSDGNTDNPRLVTITKDTTFTAEFAQNFSGQCGDSLYWSYAGHTLTISGTGAMYKYYITTVPWLLFRDTTTEVILERGITYIGTWAFNDFVKLNSIELPNTLTSIGASAFAGCLKLLKVYSYAVNPPVAENNSIFANYNVYLYVPCDNLFDYQTDVIFGSFKYIQCIGAENTTTTNAVTVTPSDNEAVFVWPADGSADTYNLQISKDGAVFCTLIFNANGQLSSIAFAPSHDRQKHRTAEQTSNGFRFTVTGLSESTHYTFDMAVKDATDATLQTYTGEFNTTSSSTAVDNTFIDSTPTKVLRDGQVLILRGNKTYTVTGVEVK